MESCYYTEYNRIEREHWWFQARRSILTHVIDRAVDPGRRLRILDLGCGTGESVRHLSRWGDVVALDDNPEALAYCREKRLSCLVRGDALRLPFAEDAFDLVCGLDILEHLNDERSALSEMRRVCRPDGRILLTVPAMPVLWGEHDELNHHLRRYRQGQLARALGSVGLEVDLITYFNTLLFAPTLAVRLWRRVRRHLRPGRPPVSDFSYSSAGALAPVLRALFGAEAPLVGRIPLPVGVSLLCLASK